MDNCLTYTLFTIFITDKVFSVLYCRHLERSLAKWRELAYKLAGVENIYDDTTVNGPT